ncbi:MAG: hypothetical protein ABIH52_02340, partial [Candidatus Aenigmatarchaeota archaeon]
FNKEAKSATINTSPTRPAPAAIPVKSKHEPITHDDAKPDPIRIKPDTKISDLINEQACNQSDVSIRTAFKKGIITFISERLDELRFDGITGEVNCFSPDDAQVTPWDLKIYYIDQMLDRKTNYSGLINALVSMRGSPDDSIASDISNLIDLEKDPFTAKDVEMIRGILQRSAVHV